MSFHLTSSNIRVENEGGRTHLRADAEAEDGSKRQADVDLDRVLGNNDGHFQWNGENFTESAKDVKFSIEGGGAVPVLRAQLRTANGEWREADVNLAERIDNVNGDLVFH
ncbi:hypothetical protein RUND412_006006 [Rhizina undulata]